MTQALSNNFLQLPPSAQAKVVAAAKHKTPQHDRWLWEYIRYYFRCRVPRVAICDGHAAPFDYVANSFFGRHGASVCWANRGGGKTRLGAITSILDSVHRPECRTRILGGSLEQSSRMYEHTCADWRHFDEVLVAEPTMRRTRLKNGSDIEIMAASAKSVRGTHVPRLKLDEIDEIEQSLYEAAVFVAQSTPTIQATIENFSTMHRPGGQMARVVDKGEATLYKWCLWETIEHCEGRTCSQCPLLEDCQGKAKRADGYIHIDDAIRWMRNSSRATWEAEALCNRPSAVGLIFPEFDDRVHIVSASRNNDLPLFRAIDFGFNFFACLWVQEDPKAKAVVVIDEYKGEQKSLRANVHALRSIEESHGWSVITDTFVDPAGKQVADQTSKHNVGVLREMGIRAHFRTDARWRNVVNGLNLMRDFLAPATGKPRLHIAGRCKWLRESMYNYAWKTVNDVPREEPEGNTPWEHPIDALRYYFVNRHAPSTTEFIR